MLLDEPLGLIVERLRRRGTDDASVEVKACTNKLSADVWETVSAFANTAGGLIILGLNEAEGFVPSANFAIDRVRDQFVSGIGDGGSAAVVTHAPRYELDRGEVDGLQVLLVRIFELELKAKPCYIGARGVQNGSYKRVDDKDIKMSPAELYELQSALLPSDADGTVVSEATVEDLDPDVVRSIIANRRLQTPRVLRGADTLEKQLVRLNITTQDGAVKLAGLLSAGIYPQQFYPKLMIDVAVHSDVEKSAPGQRFIDRQLCDGPIPSLHRRCLPLIGRNLRKATIVQGAGRREDWGSSQEVCARPWQMPASIENIRPCLWGRP
ncbi:MAG: helix-turn-helix domain-containing protein [Collinsella sp.]